MSDAPPDAADRARASRAELRRAMFLSQDSVVLCMTLRALDELGILVPSLEGHQSLAELRPEMTDVGFGALRVAMHSLAGAGWLAGSPSLEADKAIFDWTGAGRMAMARHEHFTSVGAFLAGFAADREAAWREPWKEPQVESFLQLAALAGADWTADRSRGQDDSVSEQLGLALVAPLMLWLHESSRLDDGGPDLPTGSFGEAAAELLAVLGWLDVEDGTWTGSGEQARAFALNFGGVFTYLPLFARLPEIYRGELTVSHDPGEPEWHVLRELNLRISGAAHRRYFSESEDLFVELFDREPIERQPAFVADMGCGDGSWLVHLHRTIRDRTLRGRHLDEHPLPMVGIDPDPGARGVTERKLKAAGAEALVIAGDVSDPDSLAEELARHGLRIDDGLHIRAFVDHERKHKGDGGDRRAPGWASGVYMDEAGRPISGEDVERDLIAHLRRWEPHVRSHGLVVLEAHCVAPAVMSKHLGALHGISFDAHQAYSRQYTIDHASFLRCCQEAGLQPQGQCERRYPAGRPFVSISFNRLLAPADRPPLPGAVGSIRREDTWRPDPDTDLEDGRALHEILFAGGDIRYPALWCTPPTGFVVRGALDAIETRLTSARPGDAIRIMDYGAGTGTATIELLKACHERGLEQRLEKASASIEVHLVDLPSSWFAQGYELLRKCSWTRFHSLRDEAGFRPLPEVLGGLAMDVAMANMVFHLIPPRALERTAAELANVLTPGGQLIWSAPDLGPPGPEAVLLHDPNRALRERWLELLADGDPESLSPPLAEAILSARGELDEEALAETQKRAERRIRPRPLADDVVGVLASRFEGETHTTAYEMLGEEIVRGLLVPSNQAEYMPEIADRPLREEVIRELMLNDVLPSMQAGLAGTALGLNYHWTLGRFTRLRNA